MLTRRFAVLAATLLLITLIAVRTPAAVGVGDKAPGFKLGNVEGKGTIDLSDYSGKPTVVVFWASWCPHCQNELPVLQKLYTDLKDKGVNVVGVSADFTIDNARNFIKSRHITFPNAYAGTSAGHKVLDDYGVRGIPAVYIISGGVIKANYAGEVDASTIKDQLTKLGVK